MDSSTETKILLVSGTRRPTKNDQARTLLRNLPYIPTYLLQGGCPTGIDKIARDIASEKDWPCITFQANWKRGKAAGMVRNTRMVGLAILLLAGLQSQGKDVTLHALAFPDPTFSPGTQNFIHVVQQIQGTVPISLEVL